MQRSKSTFLNHRTPVPFSKTTISNGAFSVERSFVHSNELVYLRSDNTVADQQNAHSTPDQADRAFAIALIVSRLIALIGRSALPAMASASPSVIRPTIAVKVIPMASVTIVIVPPAEANRDRGDQSLSLNASAYRDSTLFYGGAIWKDLDAELAAMNRILRIRYYFSGEKSVGRM